MDKRIIAFLLGTRRLQVTAAVDPAVIAVLVSRAWTVSYVVRLRHEDPVDGYYAKKILHAGERVVRFELLHTFRQRVYYGLFLRITSDAGPLPAVHQPIMPWCDADGTAHIVGMLRDDGSFRVEARSTEHPGTVLGHAETPPDTENVFIWLHGSDQNPFGALYVQSMRGFRGNQNHYLHVHEDCTAEFEILPCRASGTVARC